MNLKYRPNQSGKSRSSTGWVPMNETAIKMYINLLRASESKLNNFVALFKQTGDETLKLQYKDEKKAYNYLIKKLRDGGADNVASKLDKF